MAEPTKTHSRYAFGNFKFPSTPKASVKGSAASAVWPLDGSGVARSQAAPARPPQFQEVDAGSLERSVPGDDSDGQKTDDDGAPPIRGALPRDIHQSCRRAMAGSTATARRAGITMAISAAAASASSAVVKVMGSLG